MGMIKAHGRAAWRKYVVDGVSASGFNQPDTIDIFAFVDLLDSYVAALNGGGELQGEWDASAGSFPGAGAATIGQSWIASTAGTVDGVSFRIGDRVVAISDNASTATYSANWIRLASALEPVVHGADSGASTANAMAITTDYPVSTDGGQLIAFVAPVTNTSGTVTVAFNGGSALAIKTASGNNPSVGGLSSGLPVLGQITNSGTWFRLLSDQASAAIQAAAEAAAASAATAASAAAASAVAAAASAASAETGIYTSLTEIKALDTGSVTNIVYDGSQWDWTSDDFTAEIAADTVNALYIKADAVDADTGAWVRHLDGMPTIEMFGVTGDGSDESTAVKTAHDVAYALGIRELWCAGIYNAPTAWNIGKVILRGPGSINAYRKHIVPLSAKSVSSFGPGVIPSQHLKAFSRAVSPTVMIVGDSTATDGGGQVSQAQSMWSIIQRAIQRDNPGKDITFLNRAIAGTSIGNFLQTGDTLSGSFTLPSWFTPTTDTWSERAEAAAPDLVIVVFGENGASGTTINKIKDLIDDLQGYAKVPDIVLCTNIGRSTQTDSGSAEYTALRYRDQAAGALRSYADFAGLGLMDFHRLGCMMRDGFDPCEQIMTRDTSAEGVKALTATLPLTQGDFSLAFTIDNTSDAAFGSGQLLDLKISDVSGNVLRFAKSGSNFVFQNYSGSSPSYSMLGTVSTGIAVPTTPLTIEVSIRRSWAWIWIAGTLAYEGPVLRHGMFFQPTVSYASGSGPANITVTKYVASQPMLVVPALTDEEMFGVSPFLTGGNGINHPASPAFAKIRAAITDRISFAAHGQPVQQIAAAGAIDPDARAVEITGPASSTYAVTLAAPRPEDAGRTLPIEMVGTTGSNAVTLALTNITGGSAATSASFDAAGEKLVLVAGATSWEVIKESGVTLT